MFLYINAGCQLAYGWVPSVALAELEIPGQKSLSSQASPPSAPAKTADRRMPTSAPLWRLMPMIDPPRPLHLPKPPAK